MLGGPGQSLSVMKGAERFECRYCATGELEVWVFVNATEVAQDVTSWPSRNRTCLVGCENVLLSSGCSFIYSCLWAGGDAGSEGVKF